MAIGGAVAQLKSIGIVELPGSDGRITPHGGGIVARCKIPVADSHSDSRGPRALGIFGGICFEQRGCRGIAFAESRDGLEICGILGLGHRGIESKSAETLVDGAAGIVVGGHGGGAVNESGGIREIDLGGGIGRSDPQCKGSAHRSKYIAVSHNDSAEIG